MEVAFQVAGSWFYARASLEALGVVGLALLSAWVALLIHLDRKGKSQKS